MSVTQMINLTLDTPRYKCQRCKVHKYENHYSMQNDHSIESDRICNSCRIKTTPNRFDRADAPSVEWMKYRNCSEEDSELFFPLGDKDRREALWEPICNDCPVRDACLEYGRQTGSVGVWGGVELGGPRGRETTRNWHTLDQVPEEDRGTAGAMLLKHGRCNNGHIIQGPQDIYAYYSKSAERVRGVCVYCEEDRYFRTLDIRAGREAN